MDRRLGFAGGVAGGFLVVASAFLGAGWLVDAIENNCDANGQSECYEALYIGGPAYLAVIVLAFLLVVFAVYWAWTEWGPGANH